jgi:hypothetical protein
MYKITSNRTNWETFDAQTKIRGKKSRAGNYLRTYV